MPNIVSRLMANPIKLDGSPLKTKICHTTNKKTKPIMLAIEILIFFTLNKIGL